MLRKNTNSLSWTFLVFLFSFWRTVTAFYRLNMFIHRNLYVMCLLVKESENNRVYPLLLQSPFQWHVFSSNLRVFLSCGCINCLKLFYIFTLWVLDSLWVTWIFSCNLIVLMTDGYWCSSVLIENYSTLKGLLRDLCRKAVEKSVLIECFTYCWKYRNTYNMLLCWFKVCKKCGNSLLFLHK